MRRLSCDRQQHREGGALVGLAPHTDGAMMAADDAESSGEAEPTAQELGGEKRLEDSISGLFVHALPGIDDVDAQVVARGNGESLGANPLPPLGEVLRPDTQSQGAGSVSDGLSPIDYQIHHQLLELSTVPLNGGTRLWNVHQEGDLLRNRRPDEGTDLADDLADIHRLNDELSFAGVGQELSGEIRRALARLQHVLQHLGGLLVPARQQGAAGQTCVSHDAGQEIIEVVRDAAREYPDALQLLGLPERLLLLAQRLFRPLLLADIADDEHRTDYRIIRPDRCGGAGNRHDPAILVDEMIILAAEGFLTSQHLYMGALFNLVVRSIQPEVVHLLMEELADQLLTGPAEHLLGTGVSERGAALTVDEKQCLRCIVGDGIGQVDLILKQLFGLFRAGIVSDNLGKALEIPRLVAQPDHYAIGPESGAIL